MNSQNHKPGVIVIEGHVQGLSNTRALGEKGIPVYVVDSTNCVTRYSRYCQKFFRCPPFNTDEFADFLLDLANMENLKGWLLLPSNDHAVYTIAKHKEQLEKYYKVITPKLEVINKIYDKTVLLSVAQEVGVPYPKIKVFDSVPKEISLPFNFPAITKGRNGLTFYKAMGKKALLAENNQELSEQLQQLESKGQLSNSFVQELIPYDGTNKTISFTAFSINGELKTYWIGEKVREHPIQVGTATFAQSISLPQLVEPSQRLLRALKYTGVCEIEYLLDPRDEEYKLIEINARTWLWVGLAKECGVNYAVMAYNYVNGIEQEYPQKYKTGVYWKNGITDLAFSGVAILKGKLSFKEYRQTKKKYTVRALYAKRDIKPFWMFLVLLPFMFFKR